MSALLEDITGKTALVTGASSGIGRAIALRLAGAGVKVSALGRNSDELGATRQLIEAAGGKCHTISADISEAGAMQAAVSESSSVFGGLDILINNAGVLYQNVPGETPRASWEKMISINLLALIEGCDAAIAHMRAQKTDGRIVNISSLASKLTGGGIYGASKLAVEKYTDELRNSLEADSIRVTTIIPGGFSTNLSRDMPEESRAHFQSVVGNVVASSPPDADGRSPYFGLPDDVARAVLFAVSQPTFLNVSELVIRPARSIDPSAFAPAS